MHHSGRKKRFREFEKRKALRTDGRTNQRMHGWTDGLMDRRTDRPCYRDARTHLKMCLSLRWFFNQRLLFDNHKLWQSPGEQTNQPMDGKTTRRIDGKTFKPHREARTHQREGNVIPSRNSFDQSLKVISTVWVLFLRFKNIQIRFIQNSINIYIIRRPREFCVRLSIE